MSDLFRNAVALGHHFLRERVSPGDRVVDATCGNGHDTLFLADLIGAKGTVFALDVQEQALANTALLLQEHGCRERVRLFHAGHETLATCLTEPVQAVVFNLGYLPGSDKSCITRPETTVAALGQALSLLKPSGLLVVVVYPGHAGGGEESKAVEKWAAELPPKGFSAWCNRQLNRSMAAPYVVIVERTS